MAEPRSSLHAGSDGGGGRQPAAETLPGLLAAHAERTPAGVALRQKRLGIWHEITWRDQWQAVRAIATGLTGLGLRPGEVVALIGGHRVQWLQSELGIMAAGGTAAPLFTDAIPEELVSLLTACRARFAIVEGQEQVDRLLEIRAKTPALERVIYWDPRGMREYTDAWLRPLWELTGQPPPVSLAAQRGMRARPDELGNTERGEQHPGAAAPPPSAVPESQRSFDGIAELLFTPGIEGAPRAIPLTHGNLIAAARAFVEAEGIDAKSEMVSFAPNAWIGDRCIATAAALVAGYTVNLPEEPETVPQDIQEIGPRLLVAPPLAWQRLEAAARARADGSGRLRRSLFHNALDDGAPGALGKLLVANPVRDHLGLLHVRRAYNTGAPLPESTARFFRAIGVPVRQLYTVTAAGGPVAVGDEGVKALPGMELQTGADGEVLVRSPGISPLIKTEVAATGGWLPTGDLGRAEADGAIRIIDRVANVARLADGTEVLPAPIERALVASPYLRHAVVLAAGRPYVAALLAIDGPVVSAWAERRGISVTTYKELTEHPQVRALVLEAVRTANAGLPEGQRVQRVAILDRELSVEAGELTRLRTVRRAVVLASRASLIDALYGLAHEQGAAIMRVDERAAVGVT
jgi:long-chain acyl-CoA synthetase